MRRRFGIACLFAVILSLVVALCGCTVNVTIGGGNASAGASAASSSDETAASAAALSASENLAPTLSDRSGVSVTEDGQYSDKDHVALYIHEFGHLPSNYISKTKARKAGWDSEKGNLWDVLPGMSIGGSDFYNDEGALPDAKGRRYTECDIDYQGGYRNAKRIVFSNDGLVFYTDDHYKTFEQLY